MKYTLSIFFAFTLGWLIGLGPVTALAATDTTDTAGTAQEAAPKPFNPTLNYDEIKDSYPVSQFENMSLNELIDKILGVVAVLIGVLALAGLIISGIMFITAGGDEERAKRARNNIIWIITGILIYIFAIYALRLVETSIGSFILDIVGYGR